MKFKSFYNQCKLEIKGYFSGEDVLYWKIYVLFSHQGLLSVDNIDIYLLIFQEK
jgi:hypothetical protein